MAASEQLCLGIALLDDYDPGLTSKELINLGLVCVDKYQANLKDLRAVIDRNLKQEIEAHQITEYRFVNRLVGSTFHVSENDEESLKISRITNSEIVVLKRKTDVLRIWILTENMIKIGFVEAKLTTSLDNFRANVKRALKKSDDIKQDRTFLHFWCRRRFKFLNRSGEIVCENNEYDMQVLNILDHTNNSVRINLNLKPKDKCDGQRALTTLAHISPVMEHCPVSRPNGEVDDVMISYSREDASVHAELLYEKLVGLKLKVFLDKHGIDGGADWMDILNSKIMDCKYFVAFITGKYGKTKWTDFEFKAAVNINKFIIPVKFLEKYPPENYILQLGSIQYVEGVTDKPPQYIMKSWKEEEAERVAAEICSLIRKKRIEIDTTQKPQISGDTKETLKIVFLAHQSQNTVYEYLATLLMERLKPLTTKCSVIYADSVDEPATKPTTGIAEAANGKGVAFKRQFTILENEKRKKEAKTSIISAKIAIALFSSDFAKCPSLIDYFQLARLRSNVDVVLCDDTKPKKWLLQSISCHDYFKLAEKDYEEKLVNHVKNQIESNEIESEVDGVNTLAETISSIKPPLEKRAVFICVEAKSVAQTQINIFAEHLTGINNITIFTFGDEALSKTVTEESVRLSSQTQMDSIKVVNIQNAGFSEDTEDENCLDTIHTVHIDKSNREIINEVSSVCDACVLITDNVENSDALYPFIWNAKQVIPVLANETVEVDELRETFESFKVFYDVERSQLTLNGNNAVQVARTVANIIANLKLD